MKNHIILVILTAVFTSALCSQTLTEVLLPQYIEGTSGSNTNRLPFVYRARLTGLSPNAAYRYINQIVLSTDAATSNGSGNCIFAAMSGDFVLSTGPKLSTAGNYGSFTADGTGSYEGWFITEPTGNARFVPGKYIFMRIILNDGAGGTTAAARLTTADSVRVVKLDPAASDSTGTGLRCTSSAAPKDFVFTYSDTGGTGRPVSGSFIESDGTSNTTANSYAPFYGLRVDGVNGGFGMILPNALSTGIQRIEQRSLATDTVVAYAVDNDGIWPSGAGTVNPSGGTSEIVLAGTDLFSFTLGISATNGRVAKLPDQARYQYGTSVQVTATPDSGYHFVTWSGDIPVGQENDNPLTVTMDQNRTISAQFALLTSVPTLTSPTFGSITSTTAVLGAKIASNGNSPITERGVVWLTSPDPTTGDNKVIATESTTVYTAVVSGLPAGTLFHFRGYAMNAIGTGYSPDERLFTLSYEPSAHVDSVKAKSVSSTQIHLSWSAAAGADGYLVIQHDNFSLTGIPSDATGYAAGDTIGSDAVAAVIASGVTTSATITGLTPSTTYRFLIFSYAWDGSHPQTYNYKTDGSIPADSATTFAGPALTTIVYPQYIEGINGTNSDRIPFAYRGRFTGLNAGATYRFANQVVLSSDDATSDGAGNCIFVPASGNFIRTSSPSLAADSAYGTFTTDSTGSYEGWFVTEPTGNKRFMPGEFVFMRVGINDGASGTTVAAHFTTADSVRVIKLDPALSDTTGTGLRCTSAANPKDFIFAYSNTAGTGRPVSGTFIENDGTDNTVANNYAPFIANHVNGVDGAFGVVVPNLLPNGIRRFERRSRSSGAVVVYATDNDGVWPSGASTVDPSGGANEIIIARTDVQWTTEVAGAPITPRSFALYQNYPNPFNPATTLRFAIADYRFVSLMIFDVLGREVALAVNERKSPGIYEVRFDASGLSSGVYFYRLEAGRFIETKKMVVIK